MKTILIMIGLMGAVVMTGHAQDKSCVCKKSVHHTYHKKYTSGRSAAVNKKTKKNVYYTFGQSNVRWDHFTVNNNLPLNRSCMIDSNGDIQYSTSGEYSGYYPGNEIGCDIDELLVPRFPDLQVTSTAFANNGVLPAKYTCQGEQVSPPLNVSNIPAGTVSLALVMFDPHATPHKSTTYWLVWDMDTSSAIPENFITDNESQNPINKQYGYQAVCPVGGTHYYHFRVYALDTKLLLNKHANQTMVENAMRGHVLAKGELIGVYNKHLD